LWLFPHQEHQLIARLDNAVFYVVVFTPSLINKACHIKKYEDLKQSPNQQSKLRRYPILPTMSAIPNRPGFSKPSSSALPPLVLRLVFHAVEHLEEVVVRHRLPQLVQMIQNPLPYRGDAIRWNDPAVEREQVCLRRAPQDFRLKFLRFVHVEQFGKNASEGTSTALEPI
jgi:hypothetical protein